MAAYRDVLGLRAVRRVLLLGLVIRVPLFAANVILTLHVVAHLDRSYAAAGLLTGAATVALTISGPWRGRRLDRVGLRGAVAPSLAVLLACWSVAPFVGYWPLLALASLAGLFVVPTFSIVRQALMHAVDERRRQTALSIDSVVVEISFMIGPALGVLLATYWSTPWALFVCEMGSLGGSALLWLANPTLRSAGAAVRTPAATGPATGGEVGRGRRGWLSPVVVAILVAAAMATVVLTGTDVGVVAALRHMQHQSWIGWVLAVWGLGSALGGLVYGALHRPVPAYLLLALLAGTTIPVAAARDPLTVGVLLFVAGLFCAPTITATIDALSREVPERVRGEALGWHGSAMTAGSAVGAPVAGVVIDRFGWPAAFTVTGTVGLLAAAGIGLTGAATGARRRAGAVAEVERVPT